MSESHYFSNPGNKILSLDDLFDENDVSLLPLLVVRKYSGYIHKRQTAGPMGAGWLLDLWYVIIAGIVLCSHLV